MADEPDPPISISAGSAPSLQSLARIDLDPKTYRVLYDGGADQGPDPREQLLARITPREMIFIEYVYLHPEQTDEEAATALCLRANTVEAYYKHLGRNFKVRNSTELRRWAFKHQLVRTPDIGPARIEPDPGFDPWVRRY